VIEKAKNDAPSKRPEEVIPKTVYARAVHDLHPAKNYSKTSSSIIFRKIILHLLLEICQNLTLLHKFYSR
jgi:hypothetical protein